MKSILQMLVNPLGVASGRVKISQAAINVFAGVYLLLGAFAFQHIYPRLLDKMPMLGSMRKLAFWKENAFFNLQLFGYGLMVCAASLVLFIAVYVVGQLLKTGKVDMKQSTVAGLVTCIPFFLGLILGMVLLLPVHHYLGLLPFYGLLVACCLQGAILREVHGLSFALTCYLTPVLMGLQFYVISLLRP